MGVIGADCSSPFSPDVRDLRLGSIGAQSRPSGSIQIMLGAMDHLIPDVRVLTAFDMKVSSQRHNAFGLTSPFYEHKMGPPHLLREKTGSKAISIARTAQQVT